MLKAKEKTLKVSPELLQRIIHRNRVEAMEAYKERLVAEMRMTATAKQLGVVERAITRVERFI